MSTKAVIVLVQRLHHGYIGRGIYCIRSKHIIGDFICAARTEAVAALVQRLRSGHGGGGAHAQPLAGHLLQGGRGERRRRIPLRVLQRVSWKWDTAIRCGSGSM